MRLRPPRSTRTATLFPDTTLFRSRRSVGTRECREPCRRCALSLSATDFQGPSDSVIQAIAFYLFAIVVIAAAAMTISARNPVHSVLWLILAFFNAAGLMVLMGAEFIAMLPVIVHVGGVEVLFRVGVFMLESRLEELRVGEGCMR